MDAAKKARSVKARVVSRRVNELINGIKGLLQVEDIDEKLKNLKLSHDELGALHDEVLTTMEEADENADAFENETKWYDDYDMRVNKVVKMARTHMDEMKAARAKKEEKIPVKVKKLEIPTFYSEPKKFYKWQETFLRFTKDFDDDTKYDYLLSHTEGEAHKYVENRREFRDAMFKLQEKFGNVHEIMGLLIDDVRQIPVLRKGDFNAFENLSLKVNDFHDRLILMGKRDEVENGYILKEIESKLHVSDLEKWLESEGERVDDRTVAGLLKWLETQTRLRRLAGRNAISRNPPPAPNPIHPKRSSGNYVSNPMGNVVQCPNCASVEHPLTSCPTFLQLSTSERWERVKALRVCFICCQYGHRRQDCTAAWCGHCNGQHHTTLHNHGNQPRPPQNRGAAPTLLVPNNLLNANPLAQAQGPPQTGGAAPYPPVSENLLNSNSLVQSHGPQRCYLPVVRMKVKNGEKEMVVTAALDSLSELNIITPRTCELLGLKGVSTTVGIIGAGGTITHTETKIVELNVIDESGTATNIECVVLKKACGKALPMDSGVLDSCRSATDISKIVTCGGEIDLLIGQSKPKLHQQLDMKHLSNGLSLLVTRFGTSLVGPAPAGHQGNYKSPPFKVNSVILCETISESEMSMREHLQSELAGINTDVVGVTKTGDDLLFDEKMKSGLNQSESGRLIVNMPWVGDPHSLLENNRSQAESRDRSLMKQVKRDATTYNLFRESVEYMIREGVWREVSPDYPKRYLPLLTVVNLDRETTKVRICLDARCKFKGTSLNDVLLKGSVDVVDIFQATTKVRCGKFALVGDMQKMFWQIEMSPEDQQFHGVICEGKTYVCTRVCYGDKPSPAIADYSMKKLVACGRKELPLGSHVIEKKRYVDDLQDAGSTVKGVISKRDETDKLLGKFGFEIKTWRSNHPLIGEVRKDGKILGTKWDAENDTLSPPIVEKDTDLQLVKKKMLSYIASFSWDPVGMLSGLLVRGRLIFQSIVRMKCSWDELVEDVELAKKWSEWILETKKCGDLKIDRSLLPSDDTLSKCILVGFCDGSSVANGCAVYLRWSDESEEKVEVKFVGSKGRVNPIKGTTTPRAEMCGAFILSRLAYSTEMALADTEISDNIGEILLFTDSTTVISWIKSSAIKYKPFVYNKCVEIQELHPISAWKYIRRVKNVAADLISKGCSRKDLDTIIQGPTFLLTPRSDWEDSPVKFDKDEVDAEKVPDMINVAAAAAEEEDLPIDVNRFSSWNSLINTTGYVFKFGTPKLNVEQEALEEHIPCLTETERRKAELYWIKVAQKNLPDNSRLQNVTPFTDEEGVIRCNGRIRKSTLLTAEQKHPVLLPKNHKITELIVTQTHHDIYHPGHSRVIAEVRKKYWVVGLRSLAKQIGRRCVTCRRWRGKALEQIMADLPDFRMKSGLPFETTAVDYFGPFFVKFGYRQRKKVYGAIFTCLATRAVHAELVTDLTTDRFLMALRRFMSLYGQPKRMKSDKGTNFVGAASELREMLKQWRNDNLQRNIITDFCNEHAIEWTFSTPAAPHHNGSVEAMVKSVKTALNKIVKTHVLSEEEYRTVLAQVTACVNSRPLWPSTDDSLDQPITCVDLLRPAGLDRDPETMNITCNIRKRYQYLQNVTNEWWQLWLRNFVPNLQPRSKWFKTRENTVVGDIVLVIDKDTPRSKWNMGIVEEVYPGSDGLVRSVKVRTSSGTYDRPITKLTLLLSKKEQFESVE